MSLVNIVQFENEREDEVTQNMGVEMILDQLELAGDGGVLCSKFVQGSLAEAFMQSQSSEAAMEYYQQVLKFSSVVLQKQNKKSF
jgi:hypothetical protein